MNRLFTCNVEFPTIGNIQLRPLEKEDYSKGICSILGQLTSCSTDEDQFNSVFEKMKKDNNYYIVVGEDLSNSKIVLSGTLFIESKIIHNGSSVGHIEDIVVSNEFRGLNLGKILIQTLIKIAQFNQCYKVILDCSPNVSSFYEKCGLTNKGNFMAIYF